MTPAVEQFVHLHNHSEYSLLDGLSRLEHMAARVAELGMPAIALTDHGNVHGVYRLLPRLQVAGRKADSRGRGIRRAREPLRKGLERTLPAPSHRPCPDPDRLPQPPAPRLCRPPRRLLLPTPHGP